MRDRLVKHIPDGQVYIETEWGNIGLWKARLDQWRMDNSQFCPMPEGHKIFDRPQDYHCVRVRHKLLSNQLEEY
jgi:hypothetical protein